MFEKPSKLRASLFGGLIIGAISGIPGINFINCCCCAGILFGGAVSVYLYKREFTDEMPSLESSDALILGVVAGIIGALVATSLSVLITLTFGPVETVMMRDFFEKLVQQFEEQGSVPPGTYDGVQEQFEKAIQDSGSLGGILSSLVITLILYPLFSMLGGLIGYGIFGKKKQAILPTQPPQM